MSPHSKLETYEENKLESFQKIIQENILKISGEGKTSKDTKITNYKKKNDTFNDINTKNSSLKDTTERGDEQKSGK